MVAIARKLLLVGAFLAVVALHAADGDLLEPVGRLANGLSSNNPGDALSVIDKSLPGYDQLRSYFDALSDSFLLSNEVHPIEQNVAGDTATMTVQWTLTLTAQATDENRRRSGELHLRFTRRKNKWKIIELKPVSFFDPQAP